MAHFIVSYDLHYQRRYEPLWQLLESWGAVRMLESLWVVSLHRTAEQVRDALRTVVDRDDALAVVEVRPGSNWGAVHGREDGVSWFRRNIAA